MKDTDVVPLKKLLAEFEQNEIVDYSVNGHEVLRKGSELFFFGLVWV